MPYTPTELMTVMASRQLQDGDICFVGIGAPSAACNLARLTHAPDLVLIYESGTIGAKPDTLPLSIGDGPLSRTALTTVPVAEMFQYWLQGGWISKGFISGAQIDRYANINTTVIGPYESPHIRLPGGGGAPEIAALCKEVLILARQSRRTFVDRVDFVTTMGHGTGPTSRRDAGLTTKGPTMVITDLCIMEPDPESAQLTVTSVHEGVTAAQIRDATGWDLQFGDDVAKTPPPTDRELDVLRDLEARTAAERTGGHGGVQER